METNLIKEAKTYYSEVSNNVILQAKQTRKNRVRLNVFNKQQNYTGFIWIFFDAENMYLQTEIGTHGMQKRK